MTYKEFRKQCLRLYGKRWKSAFAHDIMAWAMLYDDEERKNFHKIRRAIYLWEKSPKRDAQVPSYAAAFVVLKTTVAAAVKEESGKT